MPYCETHYHAKRGSLCAGCSKPITGRCITAMFRKFHPEHFVCAFCLKQLNKGETMMGVATGRKCLITFFVLPQAHSRSKTISPIVTAASTNSSAKENRCACLLKLLLIILTARGIPFTRSSLLTFIFLISNLTS